jgi:ubiquinone/menaquinone biosynthesis C-methylase UbiE
MTTPTSITQTPDFSAITGRQRQTWGTGDYHAVALGIVPVAEKLVEATDPHAGQRVLDVACGSGNVALAAARRRCHVTGIDYVPTLLERARRRADAEGVPIDFREADAQALPFPDGSFDFVLSVFGVMFAPDQERAAAELLRVCRRGGTIGLACWTPDGFGGEFFRTVSKYAPPPPGLKPAARWGTETGLQELLGRGATAIRSERSIAKIYFASAADAADLFLTYFGPTRRAAEAQDENGRRALRDDVIALFQKYNRPNDGTLAMEADYLQAVASVAGGT